MRTVMQAGTGKTFKLGRNRPRWRAPRLRFANYLFKSLPPAPASTNYWAAADAALRQVYLNDQLGDCVIAGMQHVSGVMTGNASGAPVIYDAANTKRLYHDIGGYIDGQENTDNGCDEQTALGYWQSKGLAADGGHKIEGWAGVNGDNFDEVCDAQWLNLALVFGIEMPDAWIEPFPERDGFVWDVAGPANPDNGHCIVGVDIAPNKEGIVIATWGMKGLITPAAIRKYATTTGQGELYSVFSLDSINKASQKASNGFDATQLLADLQAFR